MKAKYTIGGGKAIAYQSNWVRLVIVRGRTESAYWETKESAIWSNDSVADRFDPAVVAWIASFDGVK